MATAWVEVEVDGRRRRRIRRVARRWVVNVLVAVDQLGNAIGGGDPDETVSSRLGKRLERGSAFANLVCRLLSLLDADHCLDAIEEDEGRDEPLRR